MWQLLIGLVAAFLVAAICGKFFIPVLHKLKFGQEIREEGPKWHEKKSGTPTMGGFIFIAGILGALVIACVVSPFLGIEIPNLLQIGMMVVVMLAYGAIGFIDDYIKVVKVDVNVAGVFHELDDIDCERCCNYRKCDNAYKHKRKYRCSDYLERLYDGVAFFFFLFL